MASVSGNKRRVEEDSRHDPSRQKKRNRSKRQLAYDSGSSSESGKDIQSCNDASRSIDLNQSNETPRRSDHLNAPHSHDVTSSVGDHTSSSDSDGSTPLDSDSDTHTATPGKKRKRNDPDAFANSISKILNSKLSTAKRVDPVLARSKVAIAASQELLEAKLETKARHKLRAEKKAQLDRGRVKDILGVENTEEDGSAAKVLEFERTLKKTAQRGVVKLFNAVRAAQVKGEQAARDAKKAGMAGVNGTEKKVNEMSKQGFLELIAAGGVGEKSLKQ